MAENVYDTLPADDVEVAPAARPNVYDSIPENPYDAIPSEVAPPVAAKPELLEDPLFQKRNPTTIRQKFNAAMEPLTTGGRILNAAAQDAAATLTGNPSQGGNLIEMAQNSTPEESAVLPYQRNLADISKAHPVVATAGKIGAGLVESAPMLAAMPQGVVGKLIGAGFTADMLAHAPGAATALGEELGKPEAERDYDKITSSVSELAQSTAFGALGATHVLGEPIVKVVERLKRAPQTERTANASQEPSATRIPQPEIRTPVGEGTPLRQPGEVAPAQEAVPAQTPSQNNAVAESDALQARGYNEIRRNKLTPEQKAEALAKPIPTLEEDAARFHGLQDAIKAETDPAKKMALYQEFGQEAELIKNRNTKSPGNPPERPSPAKNHGQILAEEAAAQRRAEDAAFRKKLADKAAGVAPQAPAENFPQLFKRLGRAGVDELLGEWDRNAQLSPDGKYITTFSDPRNQAGRQRVPVTDFLTWLEERKSKPTSPEKGTVTPPGKVASEKTETLPPVVGENPAAPGGPTKPGEVLDAAKAGDPVDGVDVSHLKFTKSEIRDLRAEGVDFKMKGNKRMAIWNDKARAKEARDIASGKIKPVTPEAPKPEKVKVTDAKKEFTDLIIEHGEKMGILRNPTAYISGLTRDTMNQQGTLGRMGSQEHGAYVKRVHESVLKELGMDPSVKTPTAFAEALPKLKKLVEEHLTKRKAFSDTFQTGDDFTHSKLRGDQLQIGEKYSKDGETLKVVAKDRDGAVTVETEKSGRVHLKPDDTVFLDPTDSFTPDFSEGEQDPDFVGMGGAVPGEFERSPNTATSIKNATVDAERAKRGLPAAMAPAKRSFGDVWDAAMAKIDKDPDYPDRLIDELKNKPRALTDLEDATLLHRQIDLQNEYGKATRDLAQAHADGRADSVIEEKARVARFSDQLYELYEVNKKAGTETGRGLNARKMMAFEDFSLAKMEMEKRAIANGGAPLTEIQRAEIEKLHAEIAQKQKAYDDYKAQTEARDAERAVKEALDRVEREAKAPKASSYVIQLAEKWVAKQDVRADAARKRLRERLGRTSAGVDPTILTDLAEIGASHIGHIGLDVAKFTEKLVADVGEFVKPHIEQIFAASKEIWEKSGAPAAVKKTVLKVKDMTREQRKEDLANKILEKMDEGKKSEITTLVQKLARQFVEDGVRGWENLLDAVHGVLQGIDPEFSRRETMDAISGYGQYKRLAKDEVSVALREAKGEMQQVAKIEDITSGEKPKPTGIERRTPSETERAKIKLVNELKKKHPELFEGGGLKGALESRKTYVRNRINDLQSEIDKGELAIKNKTKPPTDAELESLRAELESVQAEHDALFKKGMTDEQRIKLSLDAIKRQMEEYDRRIAAKDFSGKKPSRVANAPEIVKAKAERDALRDHYQELRNADEGFQRELEARKLERDKVGLEKTIAEQERKLRENDLAPKPQPVNRPANPALEVLKQQRDRLAKQIAERRKKSPADKWAAAQAKRLEQMNELIAEKQAKIAAGDVSTKPQPVNRPMSPELEIAKQKLEALNEQIRELRKPKRSEDEIALQTFKTRTANRIAEYERRLREGDFEPKPKRVTPLDSEAMRLKAAAESAKLKYMRSLELDRLSKRSRTEKILEQIAGAARASALSGYHTLFKLAGYSLAKLGEVPLNEAVGAAVSRIPGFRRIFAGANMESGHTLKALGSFYSAFATKGMRQAAEILRKGESGDKVLYDKPDVQPPRWFNFPGRLHSVEKAPLRVAAQEMYVTRAYENAIKAGIPIDEFTHAQIQKEAYDYSQRMILMENNKFADLVNSGLKRLEQKNPKTGRTELENVFISTLFKTFVTKGIVRTPSNYFAQTIARTPIGLFSGLGKAAHAHFRGIDNLTPVEKNAIARLVKVGAVGSAFFLWGMIDATQDQEDRVFGGYYSPGRKKGGKDVDWGRLRVDGKQLPHIMTHNPLTESAQMGSTLMRVFIARSKKGKDGTTAALDAGVKSLVGLVSKAPIANPIMRLDAEGHKVVGGLLQGLVPQLVQNIAEDTDLGEDGKIERTPQSALDEVAVGIPGLRQTVKQK